MSLFSQLIYAVLFQIGWLICVCLGDVNALVFAVIFTLFHLGYVRLFQTSHRALREIYWILLIGVMGYLLDTLFFCAGVIYQSEPPELFARFSAPPTWLFALWLCFAIALRTYLSFIFRFPVLSYGLAALAIPASYLAGTYLNNSVHINKPYALSLLLITLSWSVFIALLHQIKRRYFEDIFNDR